MVVCKPFLVLSFGFDQAEQLINTADQGKGLIQNISLTLTVIIEIIACIIYLLLFQNYHLLRLKEFSKELSTRNKSTSVSQNMQ